MPFDRPAASECLGIKSEVTGDWWTLSKHRTKSKLSDHKSISCHLLAGSPAMPSKVITIRFLGH